MLPHVESHSFLRQWRPWNSRTKRHHYSCPVTTRLSMNLLIRPLPTATPMTLLQMLRKRHLDHGYPEYQMTLTKSLFPRTPTSLQKIPLSHRTLDIRYFTNPQNRQNNHGPES